MTDYEILHADEKSYTKGDYNITISIINVSNEKEMDDMVQRMKEYLTTIPLSDNTQHRYVLICDLISYTAELIYYDNSVEEYVFKVFSPNDDGRLLFDSVPSRKNNIVPNLIKAYETDV